MQVETSLTVRLTPRSVENAVRGFADSVLHVRVTAPPVDGAANAALVAVLSDVLDTPKSRIRIVAGASSRNKRVVVEGMAGADMATILSRFSAPSAGGKNE